VDSSWETGGAVFKIHKLLVFGVFQGGRIEKRDKATRILRRSRKMEIKWITESRRER
jgi:hypothetical protein